MLYKKNTTQEVENRPFVIPTVKTNYRINSISRVYANVNSSISNFFQFENITFNYGNIEKYEIIGYIGSGRFCVAFKAKDKSGNLYAIKSYREVHTDFIKREIYFTNAVKSCPNVINIRDVVQDKLTGTISLISDFFVNQKCRTLFPQFTIDDIRYYIYKLLQTLDKCHSLGIMHRDIKPDNVLINHTQRELAIIDWGLAELYIPKRQYSPGVGTLRYKAPELLLGYLLYDYGVDIWAVGVTMGENAYKISFFQGRSHDEIIGEIADLLSGSSILVYADELGIEVCDVYLSAMPEYNFPKWGQMVSEMNPELRDNDALDLLKKLLTVDHMKRISAKEALQHQFFDKLTRE